MTHWRILYLALMVLYLVFKTERKNFTDTHSVENAQTAQSLQEDHIVFEKKGGQTSLGNFLLVVI